MRNLNIEAQVAILTTGVLILTIFLTSNSHLANGIGQPLKNEESANLTDITPAEGPCVGRITFCSLMKSMADSNSSKGQAQTELSSGNNTEVKSLLDNASQILSLMNTTMSSEFRLGG